MRPLILVFCLAILDAAHADPAKLLEALRTELRAEVKETKANAKPNEASRSYASENLFSQLPTPESLTDDTLPQVVEVLEQMRRITLSDKVDDLGRQLSNELRERADKSTNATRERVNATLVSLLNTGLSAKKAADLDAPIKETAQLEKDLSKQNYRSQGRGVVNADVPSSLGQILIAIQDEFLAVELPSSTRRTGGLGERIIGSSAYAKTLSDLMPRSELLKRLQAVVDRINPPSRGNVKEGGSSRGFNSVATEKTNAVPVSSGLSVAEIQSRMQTWIADIKTVDDIADAVTKIDKLINDQHGMSYRLGMSTSVVDQLRSFQHLYEEFKAGSGTLSGFTTGMIQSGADGGVELVRTLVLKYALSRILRGPADLVPTAEEGVPAYLQRSIDKARAASDWALMGRAVDCATLLGFTNVANSTDSLALRYFISGLNQEKAELYAGAVVSFNSALKTGSLVIPAESVGAHIVAIKKAHPEEYERGQQAANAQAEDKASRAGTAGHSSKYTPPDPARAAPFTR